MNPLSPSNAKSFAGAAQQCCEKPEPISKPRIPALLDDQEKRLSILFDAISRLDNKTRPVQRLSDPTPCGVPTPPPNLTTYYDRLALHNEAIGNAINQIEEIMGLLEI